MAEQSSLHLASPIAHVRGLGPKTADIFTKHGIHTVEDLLYFWPRAWMNATEVTPISDLRPGSNALISATVAQVREGLSQKSRKPYLRATVADTSGAVEVMWFHASYLKQKVKPGQTFLLYGNLQGWKNNNKIIMSPKFIPRPCIIPIYPAISGLPSSRVQAVMKEIKSLVADFPDYLPSDLREANKLQSLSETIMAMHWPESITEINHARLRLGFDELLMLMVPTLLARQEREGEVTEQLTLGDETVAKWCQSLPFELTPDQQAAIRDILNDLASTRPMNRLIQGDVGTGKTVVGLAGAVKAIASGKQVVWLAPTELLARQHFETAKTLMCNSEDPPAGGGDGSLDLFENRHSPGILRSAQNDRGVALWTRTQHVRAIPDGEEKITPNDMLQASLVIGTHALLSEKINFSNLGLLIIDEQHRFGVAQRAKLRVFNGAPVHLLSMTATPIPRTMALLLYGDLQLSTIKQKPSGRKPVLTKVVAPSNRDKAYAFVDEQVAKGGQVYVVCPTIEPAKDEEANLFNQLFDTIEEKKAVTAWYEVLTQKLPHRRIGLLHGKLKAKDKEAVMTAFRSGEIDILVSTTVIEVGVDVPNANIMIIEAANRFGLAQLHQLRGRVGRGTRQSFCFLFPEDELKENARLAIMEATSDGFVLAEKDLELRGPGEITGLAQSGIPPLRFASLQDSERIATIQKIAAELVRNPHFTQSFERFWRLHHPE